MAIGLAVRAWICFRTLYICWKDTYVSYGSIRRRLERVLLAANSFK